MSGTFPPPPPLDVQLAELHGSIAAELPGVSRIAIAAYDDKTDSLQTFTSSNQGEVSPLSNYDVRLNEVPSLRALADQRKDRVIDDLSVLKGSTKTHSKKISERYGSSYTRPLVDAGRLRGFIFFDSEETFYFKPAVVARLTVYSELVAALVTRNLFPASILRSAVEVATEVSHTRDPETGAHLDRMSRYALAIGRGLAASLGLRDEWLQHLLTLSPLHDLGKVAIPDAVLLKPARLNEDELVIMRTHPARGAEMVRRLVERLGLGMLPQADMLTNIVECHHECWDGSGYPQGKAGEDIPLEARIVMVADVYDALTSERPYKEAWKPEAARSYIEEGSGSAFDPAVVRSFVENFAAIEEIRAGFPDEGTPVRFHEAYDDNV